MTKIKMTVAVPMLALIIAAAGCTKASSDGAVLAKVNRGAITAEEFKQQLEDLAPQMQQAIASDPKARKEFLEDLIGIELVIQEAKRQGLEKDAEFRKRQEMLKKELGEKMSGIAQPSDEEVREYYNKNKDKIKTADGRQIGLKEVEPQLRTRIQQEKRRDVYLEYAKGLKARANISVDDKALEAAAVSLSRPHDLDLSNMEVQPAPGK